MKVTDRAPGRALQALRIAAGFRSAAAAAARYKWSASRYVSHESGARPILADDAKRYAAAYGVKEKQILSPDPDWLRDLQERNGSELYRSKKGRAGRLFCARILAGYASYAEVARKWDIKPSTYLKHEQGENALGDHFIELYGLIFGVRAEWLRSGELPSGMGSEIDRDMAAVLRNPANFRRSPFLQPARDLVASLKDAAAPGRPGVSSLGIPEYDWSELESAGGKIAGLAHRSWSMPATFFADLGLDQRRIFIVVANVDRDGLEKGERLFVWTGNVHSKRNASLVFRRGKLMVSEAGTDTSRVGEILWRLAPVRQTR